MNEQHSSEVLDRLLQGAGVRRDAQLAELLGVTPQAVSQARRKATREAFLSYARAGF